MNNETKRLFGMLASRLDVRAHQFAADILPAEARALAAVAEELMWFIQPEPGPLPDGAKLLSIDEVIRKGDWMWSDSDCAWHRITNVVGCTSVTAHEHGLVAR